MTTIYFHYETIFVTIWTWTMINFNIERIFVTMWHWSMVNRGWLCLIFILTIFVKMWPWLLTTTGHGWFSYWDNLCQNAMLNHGWEWLMLVDDAWWWLMFILRQYFSQCDVGPCFTIIYHAWKWSMMVDGGLNMVDFHIKTIFLTMLHWTMVVHYYKPNRLIL